MSPAASKLLLGGCTQSGVPATRAGMPTALQHGGGQAPAGKQAVLQSTGRHRGTNKCYWNDGAAWEARTARQW